MTLKRARANRNPKEARHRRHEGRVIIYSLLCRCNHCLSSDSGALSLIVVVFSRTTVRLPQFQSRLGPAPENSRLIPSTPEKRMPKDFVIRGRRIVWCKFCRLIYRLIAHTSDRVTRPDHMPSKRPGTRVQSQT